MFHLSSTQLPRTFAWSSYKARFGVGGGVGLGVGVGGGGSPELRVFEAAVVQPASCVGDGHGVPLKHQGVRHRVPRQPRLWPRQAPLLAHQLVHQRGLALQNRATGSRAFLSEALLPAVSSAAFLSQVSVPK